MSKRPDLAERNRAIRGGYRPYEDREWIRERYEDRQMSLRQLAAEARCGLRTIVRWMDIHEIPRREISTARRLSRTTPPRGENHWNWKGGRITDRVGYVKVIGPQDWPWTEMFDQSRYIFEHRLVMAEMLGRALLPGETVHHIDGDRSNNDPSNLQLRQGNHGNGIVLTCADCGSHNLRSIPIAEPEAVMPSAL